ncbi:conserved domain protein [Bacteroides fluxus YIT 12057]|uniref:Conserved domain protein n=1 Tax=Bacteroides fluxus YIT 12057 TaxID=763034 RepID=F3PMY0_9BACE|nr:conserved domain protein [Bacteroides fluxus YIT 12057]
MAISFKKKNQTMCQNLNHLFINKITIKIKAISCAVSHKNSAYPHIQHKYILVIFANKKYRFPWNN